MGFSPGDLDGLKDMSPDVASKVLHLVPLKLLMRMYVRGCSRVQIEDLFKEWDSLGSKKKIFKLCKALKKHNKDDWVPGFISEKYL